MNLFTHMHGETVQDIPAMDLHKELSSGNKPTLRDVSPPVEFRSGYITGAQMIPLGELKKKATRITRGMEVICSCATGQRSMPAARTLATAGYTASNLKNGKVS